MQIFREVAGYSYGKADIVRRAIAKKKPGVIEKERESFLAGAEAKGFKREDADLLYAEMTDFANYGFKKSHAAAYAFVSYRTAYLKAHHTAMYYASLISSVFGRQGKMTEYMTECAKLGIKTLPPDINESETGFSVSGGNIRYGLPAIKNVGAQFITRVIQERNHRKFTSFYDFVSRMQGADLNRRQVESLIKAGAFDSLGTYRSQLLSSCEEILASCQRKAHGNVAGQLDLFSTDTIEFRYPDLPEFSLRERLRLEKESAGMYLSGHILDDYTRHIERLRAAPIRVILDSFSEDADGDYAEKQTVTVAGCLTHLTKKTTKNGDTMLFATFEDRGGEIELIIFPKTVIEYASCLSADAVIAAECEISLKDGEPKLILRRAKPLVANDGDVPVEPVKQVSAHVVPMTKPQATLGTVHQAKDTESVKEHREKLWLKVPTMSGEPFRRALALCEIFDGQTPLVFYDGEHNKYIATNLCVAATEFLHHELKELLGDGNVILR